MAAQPLNLDDTICAISTPPGTGGIAVIRVSGPEALSVCGKIWQGRDLGQVATHTAHLGEVIDTDGQTIDQAVATLFRGPHSFTGQDTIELSVHGSQYVQSHVIDALCATGARLATAGEFTRRAVVNGRMDLAQAEGVADLLAAQSRASHRLALSQMRGGVSQRFAQLTDELIRLSALLELELDFSEEEVEFASRPELIETASQILAHVNTLHASFRAGNAIRNGIPIAIVGATNAGKSSLLNALLGDERAIVSDIHGTTRDVVEDTLVIGAHTFRLRDTAGLRHTADTIERIGIDRSMQAAASAQIIIAVIDASAPFDSTQMQQIVTAKDPEAHLIVVINKTDLANPQSIIQKLTDEYQVLTTSITKGEGIDAVKSAVTQIADHRTQVSGDVVITNARHAQALKAAAEALTQTIAGLQSGLTPDLIAEHLREAIDYLNQISGRAILPETVLQSVFKNFCIGK